MRYRTNPWPSFADLFSATLIVTFAGMVMMSAAYTNGVSDYKKRADEADKRVEEARRQAEEANRLANEAKTVAAAVSRARAEADKIIEQVQQALKSDSSMQAVTRPCGDDTCLDIYMQFPLDGSEIKNDEQLATLRRACSRVKKAIDALPAEQRKDIEIVIEGHTDSTQPEMADSREKYLYNWDLSARRATSVAYEFKQMGLTPDLYRIVAIGYADSVPICSEDTPECRDRNRRTTLILRGDTRQIENRLNRQPAAAATPAGGAAR
jgi:outer membrane protein OmpA-like peptidoglycan-associated protein